MAFRTNIITLGILLLLVFAGAIFLIGGRMNRAAKQLSNRIVKDACHYRSDMVAFEFRRTQELQKAVQRTIHRKGRMDEEQLALFVASLGDFDVKVSRIWFLEKGRDVLSVFVRKDSSLSKTEVKSSHFKAYTLLPDSLSRRSYNMVYQEQGCYYWSTVLTDTENTAGCALLGFDFLLTDLQAYFAAVNLYGNSYVFVVNGDDRFILHPEEKLLGQKMSLDSELKLIRQVRESGKEEVKSSFSSYLLLSVTRTYYPLKVGDENWVVGVSIPEFVSREEMDAFHRSAFLIACVTILLFCILLFYSWNRWKKENELRRKVEQESAELALQQLKNRMSPHFLFNSLSSLSVLVDTNVQLAKEFILRLSKVYRYLLEKRNAGMATVGDEVKFMEQYYFLQKIRFEEQLQLDMDVPREITDKKIPSMSLQILVENAIKHNEITMQHPLHIRIYGKGNVLVVENNYQPRRDVAEESMGVGLEHIREIYKFYTTRPLGCDSGNGVFVCELPLL